MVRNIYYTFMIAMLLFALNNNLSAQQAKDTLRYRNNPAYSLQNDLFNLYKTTQADIIMFGNSLTAGASWHELLGRPNVVGRGIPSDVLQGYYARINSIIQLKPKIVFILGGLNDVYNWTPVDEIYTDYLRVISLLKAKNIIPVIQSTIYAGKEWGKNWGGTPETNAGRNKEVDKLNKLLSDYAKRNNIDYIDLNSKMSTKDNFLRPELTWDGVHLNAAGYSIWVREVENVLRKYKL